MKVQGHGSSGPPLDWNTIKSWNLKEIISGYELFKRFGTFSNIQISSYSESRDGANWVITVGISQKRFNKSFTFAVNTIPI